MSFAAFLGGTVAPVLLMLSPFAVMAAKDCDDWKPAAKAVKSKDASCTRPRPPLM
ncbi:hypothetical protein [Sphingobium sp. CAP-1]|uniref:hypothetical protein n=1 Tax=Sphingobium sp. CAP-1 TaxID=2676077 RepID=UPI0018AD1791|nr:hypothetical protein [Sphingobium sp. CAP-1]